MFRLFITLVLCLVLAGFGATAVSIKISLDSSAMQPGQVFLLTVQPHQPARSVNGQAFGSDIRFYPADQPETWQALVGVDLDVPPGEQSLVIHVVSETGEEVSETRTITIAKKTFPTRYLTVPENYVNPPEQVQERIRREAEEIKTIFSTASLKRLWKGGFDRPVPGRLVSTFGKRSVLNGQPRSVHAGVDLRAPVGTPLNAPGAGRVVLAKELYFAGNTIILDHGLGLYSYFAHLSRFSVKEGQLVQRGEIIGLTGKSGRVEGPHLHWSVRLCNSRVDPIALLSVFSTP